MGAVTFSIDLKLAKMLQQTLQINLFIETGTMQGDTVALVKDIFQTIYSIELSEDYFLKAKTRFETHASIHILHGDSSHVLPSIATLCCGQPILYWLDAHWCVADQSAGSLSQCPLLLELGSIGPLHPNSVVVIDDARLFIAPPPPPHDISQWPLFSEILLQLNKLSASHHLIILNDCIIYYPQHIQSIMSEYAYHQGTDWLHVMDKSREYDYILNELILKEEKIQEQAALLKQLHTICTEQTKKLNNTFPNKLKSFTKKILTSEKS